MTKPRQGPKTPPKSPRQRKSEFDERMKNRGLTTPDAPERWACIFYLTEASKNKLKRYRDEASFLGDGADSNAAVFEDMLSVYETWRQMPETLRPGSGGSSAPPVATGRTQPAALVAFKDSVAALKQALGRTESCLDLLIHAHREERWLRFDSMVARVIELSASGLDRARLNRELHSEVSTYISDLVEICEREAVADVPLEGERGRLFGEILRRVKA